MNRIALIEDHSRLADLVRQALGNAGIETDVFHAMEPAWLALRDITYGVVVIDRGLPDGDGLEEGGHDDEVDHGAGGEG